ncbi:MAG: hypothetical protein RL656_1728 [Bacteroidota bacterium]
MNMKLLTPLSRWFIIVGILFLSSSCFKDLETIPLDKDVITSAVVYNDPKSYRQVLAKLYAGLAVSGQQGPAGQPDISGIDEGFSTYLRQYWKAQELPTEEAVIAWNDGNIKDYHEQDWDANNEFIAAMYNRIFYQISLCNEFLRETTDEKLSSRNTDAATRSDVEKFRVEARFLRALSYYHALDMFRNVPFVTEKDKVGAFFPEQISANDLFNFIETELKEIETKMVAPRTNEYGRADQAAAWSLLAKLYLNAETYTGQKKYTESLTFCKKVIGAGYTLQADYKHLFTADNHKSKETIFAINFDGIKTRTWGGMTFVVHAAVGGKMNPANFGVDGGWGGTRVTSGLVKKFPSTSSGSVLVTPSAGNTSKYPKLFIPGSYQKWDPSNANTVITSPGNNDKYEGYFWFDGNTEFKINAGPNWDVNFGDNGADGKLDQNGDNIRVVNAGFYKLNVDYQAKTYTLNKTIWGLIGSATKNGWDSDQDLKYDAKENAWIITADLVKGEIKFRANDGWDLNYGDDGGNAVLEAGGANIVIPSAGTYNIKLFLNKPDYTYAIELASFDSRSLFFTDGQELEIADISQFTDGYAVTKFTNLTSTGGNPSDLTFIDTDFPLFRLADIYLTAAEAIVRGGTGGSAADALNYVNIVRRRAYAGPGGDITSAQLTLDFLLDERGRELYWEAQRRTDLVRFGKFSATDYRWPWKGGVKDGRSVNKTFDVFPIPASDIGANPKLKQNAGY